MHIYIYTHICRERERDTHTSDYTYTHIIRERERERRMCVYIYICIYGCRVP